MKCRSCQVGRLRAQSVSDPDSWDDQVEITIYFKCVKCNAKYQLEIIQDWFQLKYIDPYVPKKE